MADDLQRWGSRIVVLGVLGLTGWMSLDAVAPRPAIRKDADAGAQDASAPTAVPVADAGSSASADADGGLFLRSMPLFDGGLMMPSSAPRNIRIGVVLVAYAGAEGAPTNARSKHDAQVIAERLGADARADFHRAVSSGDPGSSDDIGRLPRGVLDPRTEISVFALAAGDVSVVLETPRGYWIVKRIE